MPDAKLVTDEKTRDPILILRMLENEGVLKRISIKGVNVWGRHTMTKEGIRAAFKKRAKKVSFIL